MSPAGLTDADVKINRWRRAVKTCWHHCYCCYGNLSSDVSPLGCFLPLFFVPVWYFTITSVALHVVNLNVHRSVTVWRPGSNSIICTLCFHCKVLSYIIKDDLILCIFSLWTTTPRKFLVYENLLGSKPGSGSGSGSDAVYSEIMLS